MRGAIEVHGKIGAWVVIAVIAALAGSLSAVAQYRRSPQGHAIGTVAVQGHLIVMTLNPGVLGKENLFDLNHRTLRFSPDGNGYRIANLPLHWIADFGPEATGAEVTLHNFTFPFSGEQWSSLSVGSTGSIAFPPPQPVEHSRGRFGPRGGVQMARFAQLRVEGRALVASAVPAICVFLKPRMRGRHYVKELADRVVITWDLSEPYGGIQDFSWTPTVNRFQVVLHKDGTIEMSYQTVAAQDAIVGVYPHLHVGMGKVMATLAAAPGSTGLRAVKLVSTDGVLTKVTFETAGPVPPPSAANAAFYEIEFRKHSNAAGVSDAGEARWMILHAGRFGRRGYGGRDNNTPAPKPAYRAVGMGVEPTVTVVGDSLSIEGVLPAGFKSGDQIMVSAQAGVGRTPAGQVEAHAITLRGLRDPEVNFSSVKPTDGPFPVAYESFHYLDLPDVRDLACTVIQGLGDNYDFLTYYSGLPPG